MPITTRYILRQILRPLVGAMAIGLMVLLAERMVRLLDITLGKKNSFSLVFEMLAYLVPHYLGLAIPAAFFLGLLFGFNKLSKDSELDAFLASGIGLHQVTRPVVILAFGFTMIATLDRQPHSAAHPLCVPFAAAHGKERSGVLSRRRRRLHARGNPHLHPRQAFAQFQQIRADFPV